MSEWLELLVEVLLESSEWQCPFWRRFKYLRNYKRFPHQLNQNKFSLSNTNNGFVILLRVFTFLYSEL